MLLALGLSHDTAHGSLRLTLGQDNTEDDVGYILEVLPGIIKNLRMMSPLGQQLTKNATGVCSRSRFCLIILLG